MYIFKDDFESQSSESSLCSPNRTNTKGEAPGDGVQPKIKASRSKEEELPGGGECPLLEVAREVFMLPLGGSAQ